MTPPPRPESDPSVPKQSLPVSCSNIPVWAQAARRSLCSGRRGAFDEDRGGSGDPSTGSQGHKGKGCQFTQGACSLGCLAQSSTPTTVNGSDKDSLSSQYQPLVPGRRYIVFAIGNDSRQELVTKDSPLSFDRCGVQEDTPEIRRDIEKGFAQNDTLRP